MFSFSELQETTWNSMPNASTDKPLEAATAVSVNHRTTAEDTTTDRLVEMTDDSVHDPDLGSSTSNPQEQILGTEIDTITEGPLDTITTSVNDIEATLKTTLNFTNNVDDIISQDEPQNIPDNLVNGTEINFSVVEKSKTTENGDRKAGTRSTTTDKPDELVNVTEIYTSVHTTPETDRHAGAELPVNETEFDLTTQSVTH